MRKYTRRIARFIPEPIRHNWITILVALFIVWMTYVSVEVKHTSHATHHLSLENAQRISDVKRESQDRDAAINASRLSSCTKTYSVMQQILRASASGRHLTQAETDRLNVLLSLADPKRCKKQTKPASPTGGG